MQIRSNSKNSMQHVINACSYYVRQKASAGLFQVGQLYTDKCKKCVSMVSNPHLISTKLLKLTKY